VATLRGLNEVSIACRVASFNVREAFAFAPDFSALEHFP
jgi:hypothetical protein